MSYTIRHDGAAQCYSICVSPYANEEFMFGYVDILGKRTVCAAGFPTICEFNSVKGGLRENYPQEQRCQSYSVQKGNCIGE